MIDLGYIKQYLFSFVLALLLVAHPAFASDEQVLLRGVAADYMDILARPKAEQASALRAFSTRHQDLLLRLSKLPSPGKAILEARVLGSAVDWTPEMDNFFVGAIDSTFKHQRFLKLLQSAPVAADLFQFIPDSELNKILDRSSTKLGGIKVSDQPGFKRILDPKTGVTIANEDARKLAEDILPKFYDNLPVKMKANILSAVLRLPPDAGHTKQASEVLQNSGPIAQKLFQLIGRETSSEAMQAVMEELQANIKPIPQNEIIEVIEKRYGKKVGEIFSKFSEPIKSGTVGQVHFAHPLAGADSVLGDEVAVKILRPGVVEAFHAEVEALHKATKGTTNEAIVSKIENSVGKELNFLEEAANLKAGEVYINDKKGIGIASLAPGFQPAEDVLVMRKAPGMKINKFVRSSDLLARGQAMSNLLEAWITESVFQDGFFHGDLHPGNVYFDLKKQREEPKGVFSWLRRRQPPAYDLTMLDFGNAGRITLQQQRAFIKMLAAITLRSPDDLYSAISTLGKVPNGTQEKVMEDLAKALARPPTYPLDVWYNAVFSEILETCLTNKVEMPDSFLAFNRGKAFLEIELHEVNKLLDAMDPKGKLKRFDAARPMARAFLKQVPMIPISAMKSAKYKDEVLTFEMMRDIAKMWSNSLYEKPLEFCRSLYRAISKPKPPRELSAKDKMFLQLIQP